MSSAEHLYYIYQLSLSPSQSAQFLASLSSNPMASDDHLRSLTPTGEADRRGSVAGVRSSAARTALFRLCVTLVEAFLDHDNGDGGHGGGARAAVTAGSLDLQSGPAAPASIGGDVGAGTLQSSRADISETECRLRLARAERERSSQPPPEYHGPHDKHATANQAEFEKRKLRGACFACLNSRVKYDVFHLDCSQHGRGATAQQRREFRAPGSIIGNKNF